MVGVSGFEPEASWTRTKRDTKLRHTPMDRTIILEVSGNVKRGTGEFWRYIWRWGAIEIE